MTKVTADYVKEHYVLISEPTRGFIAKGYSWDDVCAHNWIFYSPSRLCYLLTTALTLKNSNCAVYAPKNLNVINY